MSNTIGQQIVKLIDGLNLIERANKHEYYQMLTPDTYSVDPKGRKYARIVRNGTNQRFVEMFVDRATGDVYYPAGWTGPAKHIRGNIATDDNLQTLLAHKWLHHYGYLYLQSIEEGAKYMNAQRDREIHGLLSPIGF